jgi:glucokinase
MIGAIDIGGTKIALGLVNEERGAIVRQVVFPTEPQRGFKDGMGRVCAAMLKLLEESGMGVDPTGLRGIGVGCTGPLDPFSGVLAHNADTLPSWQGHNLVEGLKCLGVPVVVENDADAAVLGEYTWGAGQGSTRFLYVTISTGIGSGAVLDHKLYRGVDGSHPEIGHSVVDPNGPPCYCGATGCWEMLASGTALAAWYNTRKAGAPEQRAAGLSARQVCALAEQGDRLAQSAVQHEADYLGLGLSNLVNYFVPDVIALGGGVIKSWPLFKERVQRVVAQNTHMVPSEKVRILPARLGDDAALLGAAQAWLDRIE